MEQVPICGTFFSPPNSQNPTPKKNKILFIADTVAIGGSKCRLCHFQSPMVDTQQHIFQLQYTSILSQQPPNFNIHIATFGNDDDSHQGYSFLAK
jgi:hypothetical protein